MRLSRLCEAIVALSLLEAFAAVWGLRARRRIGAVSNALAGVSLAMAVRTALEGRRPARTVFWIAASLPAHLADLGSRLRT